MHTHPHTPQARVIARTTHCDHLNEWVVEVDGVRRARFVGYDAVYYAAREANRWRQQLKESDNA